MPEQVRDRLYSPRARLLTDDREPSEVDRDIVGCNYQAPGATGDGDYPRVYTSRVD